MKVAYEPLRDIDEVMRHLAARAPKTVVFDVEPLVAYWDTDPDSLQRGVTRLRRRITAEVGGVEALVFATNSARTLPTGSPAAGEELRYVAHAAKPLRTGPYEDLPRPGVVVGDQIATDGVLAWRLGYAFVHYRPELDRPLGPRMMEAVGRPLRSVLFTRRG